MAALFWIASSLVVPHSLAVQLVASRTSSQPSVSGRNRTGIGILPRSKTQSIVMYLHACLVCQGVDETSSQLPSTLCHRLPENGDSSLRGGAGLGVSTLIQAHPMMPQPEMGMQMRGSSEAAAALQLCRVCLLHCTLCLSPAALLSSQLYHHQSVSGATISVVMFSACFCHNSLRVCMSRCPCWVCNTLQDNVRSLHMLLCTILIACMLFLLQILASAA